MPTILTQTPVATRFNISTGNIEFTDSYGLAGSYPGTYSIPNSGVKGVLTVTAPGGAVIYNNTSYVSPDINGATPTWTKSIPIPTNVDGSLVSGTYAVTYTTQIIDGVNPTYLVVNNATYAFSYTSPVVSIVQTIDCVSPNFKAVDTTDYSVSSVTPTVARTFDLYYPVGSAGDGTPLTTTTNTISTGTFYQGTQTNTVSSILTFTFPATGDLPTYTIYDVVTATKTILVDCAFICQIACCLEALEVRMSNVKGVNQVLYEQYAAEFSLVMSYVQLALVAISCGQSTLVNGYIAEIESLSNCTTGCNCGGKTPSKVIGLGGSNIDVNVVSGGAPVVVTSSTVGSLTTYTITLSQTFIDIVNNSYNTTVTSVDSSVTVVASGTNPKNYDLAVALPTPPNRMEFKLTMTWAPVVANSGNVTIAISNVVITGTKFQSPTIVCDNFPSPSWANLNNVTKVSGFYITSPSNNYKVLMTSSNESAAANTLKTGSYTFLTNVFGRNGAVGEFYFNYLFSNPASPLIARTNAQMASRKEELTIVISE